MIGYGERLGLSQLGSSLPFLAEDKFVLMGEM